MNPVALESVATMASSTGSKRKIPSSNSSASASDNPGHSSSSSKSHCSAGPLKRDRKIEAKLDMTGGEITKRLLECPICLEILLSPIYQCPGGHIICKTCKPKLQNCPSCEEPIIGIIRSLVLESILENVAFPCNHHHKGCKVLSKIQNLQKHIEECDYKPLKCHLHGLSDCNETSLYLVDTLRHLEVTHKLETVEAKRGHQNVFTSKNDMSLTADDDDMDDDGNFYYSELFRFDNNVFVAVVLYAEFLTHFGFYLLGSKEEASKYSVTITVEETNLKDVVFKLEVTTRITSIRDFQAELADPKVPHEAVIDRAAFIRDGDIAVQEDANWEVKYTINKV